MDLSSMRERMRATLAANSDIRRQAELDLKQAESQQGFVAALFSTIEGDPEPELRLASVLYLKNRVSRGWSAEDEPLATRSLSPDDKATIRARILPVLPVCSPQIRSNLLPVIHKILQHDFPNKWPEFVAFSIQLIDSQEANALLAGLHCVLTVCKVYRFKAAEYRAEFDQLVQLVFPKLLAIGSNLVNSDSAEAAEVLRLIVKSYKQAVFYDMPPSFAAQDSLVGWCTLFVNIIGKTVPADQIPEDVDDRERSPWWKSKKWSYANLNRLFIRYGNPATQTSKSTPEQTAFAKNFLANFAPGILTTYLAEIEKWVSKTIWLSKPALSYTLIFLEECVKPKAMWTTLKGHMENLIQHVLFPILCQSEEDLELFMDDPHEYVHRKLNYYEEVSAPDVAATNFLVALTKSRRNQTYVILKYVNEVVTRYEAAPDNQKNPREKEGALRMIGSLAEVLLAKNSPIAGDVEFFFIRYIFPEFKSPHGFLRARACNLVEKFEKLEFKEVNNLMYLYQCVLECMSDQNLPVRIEAALALQILIRQSSVRTALRGNVSDVMQQLLKLSNEVDVDSLANVMEDFVEVFSTELTPHSVRISASLRDNYLRIIQEISEKNTGKDEDDLYGDYMDDKAITALGVLQTLGTLILSLENTPQVLLQLEEVLLPIVTTTLDQKLMDLWTEVFEIVDSCTYSAKQISPVMWQAFECMQRAFQNGGEIYFEDMLPALENFITFGSAQLIQQPAYLDALMSMVRYSFNRDKMGGMDTICGCRLAESMMLNLKGQIDAIVPLFIDLALTVLVQEQLSVKSVRTHVIQVVINALYYNPVLSLQYLEGKGWTNKFFSAWFSNIENFNTVHDKKLSIFAIIALLSLGSNDIPVSVQQGWPRLMQGVIRLFDTLPLALKRRAELVDEGELELSEDGDDDDEDDWEADEKEWEPEAPGQETDVKDGSAQYLEFLSQEAQKYSTLSDEEDDLAEESLMDTPLDAVEPYGAFKSVLIAMQQYQPQLYETLIKVLTVEEQAVLQRVMAHANQLAPLDGAN